MKRAARGIILVALSWLTAVSAAWAQAPAGNVWAGLKRAAPDDADRARRLIDQLHQGQAAWQQADTVYYTSVLNPGVLVRMRTRQITYFAGLDAYDAEPPSFMVVKTASGPKSFGRDVSVSGQDLAGPWILCSFQGGKGWEKFDAPWLVVLQKRPMTITLTKTGLVLKFAQADTGYIFSMPLYGYDKPPQQGNDLCAKYNLPSQHIYPWTWHQKLPDDVAKRCDWWASVARAYPVYFQERFRVEPKTDDLVFHHKYDWLITQDDWGTKATRFATISPGLGLAWKYPGFPMTFSSPIHDPDYFTAFGPYVGALNVDDLEIRMHVLQYVNELEYLDLPKPLSPEAQKALDRIQLGMTKKFEKGGFPMDYGDQNFVWSMVHDVWYSKGLEFIDGDLKAKAVKGLHDYVATKVLKDFTPFQGKFIVHGPGIGSWGNFGDAGKFATNMIQGIWGYGQYTGDWDLARQRWDSHVKKFFITPEESNWVTFGRNSIAEMGDEAPPCSAYARTAWAVGDRDEYLFGCYMYARELVHHYIKQVGGAYFYEHQPYNNFEPMPPEIYPTVLYTSSTGWQVDGPIYGHGEHQSSNRWVRFHDPDTGRFYRDHLADTVRKELAWYETEGQKDGVFAVQRYRDWAKRDQTHIVTGLARLRSFLLGEPYSELIKHAKMEDYVAYTPAEDIAVGYAYLRSLVPVRHRRLVPQDLPASPEVSGLAMGGLADHDKVAQEVYDSGREMTIAWYLGNSKDWGMPKGPKDSRRFGQIRGDFSAGEKPEVKEVWTGYGCRVRYVSPGK